MTAARQFVLVRFFYCIMAVTRFMFSRCFRQILRQSRDTNRLGATGEETVKIIKLPSGKIINAEHFTSMSEPSGETTVRFGNVLVALDTEDSLALYLWLEREAEWILGDGSIDFHRDEPVGVTMPDHEARPD